jgi:hypothetical protein
VLGLPIEQVPHFLETEDDSDIWWLGFGSWCGEHGVSPLFIEYTRIPDDDVFAPVLCIAHGEASRGVRHAVVWKGSEMVHDPHPSRAGLIGEPDHLTLLVVQDPGALAAVERETYAKCERVCRERAKQFYDENPDYDADRMVDGAHECLDAIAKLKGDEE